MNDENTSKNVVTAECDDRKHGRTEGMISKTIARVEIKFSDEKKIAVFQSKIIPFR